MASWRNDPLPTATLRTEDVQQWAGVRASRRARRRARSTLPAATNRAPSQGIGVSLREARLQLQPLALLSGGVGVSFDPPAALVPVAPPAVTDAPAMPVVPPDT